MGRFFVVAVVALLATGGFAWCGFQPVEMHGEIGYSVDIVKTGTPTAFSLNFANPNVEYEKIVDETNFDHWFHPNYIIDEPQGDAVYGLWVHLEDPAGVRIAELDDIISLEVKGLSVGSTMQMSEKQFSFDSSHPAGAYTLTMVLRYKYLPSSIGWTTLDTETIPVVVAW